MNRRTIYTVLGTLLVFGVGAVLYGFIEVLTSTGFSSAKASNDSLLALGAVFFLFGVWAGFVMLSKEGKWFGQRRPLIHAISFSAFGGLSLVILAPSNYGAVAVVAAVFAVLGYFGERWIEHI